MKTIFHLPVRKSEASGRKSDPRSLIAALRLLALLALATPALAAVDTLTGGPFQGNPTYYGYVNGDTFAVAQFHTPSGLALDTTGNLLFVADCDNHAIRRLNLSGNLTETFVTAGLTRPVALAIDNQDNLYVLNQGNGANGTLQKFDRWKNPLGTLATGLLNPTALALDGSANAYLTLAGNTVLRVGPAGSNILGVITLPGTALNGIVVLDSGMLALSDGGNHGLWLLNPDTGAHSPFTGFNGPGDTFGPPAFAQFNQPAHLAKAGAGKLVLADRGNHRVKIIDSAGTVTLGYGTAAADWVTGWPWPGWYDGDACDNGFGTCAEAREPLGLTVAPDGTLFSTEVYYHILRQTTGIGLLGPGGGGSGGSTNTILVTPPTISPDAGYFPMGQLIAVGSPNPDVFYTTDGSTPTTNSLRVPMTGNSGVIRWGESTRDLTWLRVRSYVGTNASAIVRGQPVAANTIGVPPGFTPQIQAGVGATVILPVVTNLRTNDRVRSLQFLVEVTPDASHANNISDQFRVLSIRTNDFAPVVTAAQGATSAVYSATSYATSAGGGRTNRGLAISAIGTNANVVFSNYAVVAMLAVPIPNSASEGQSYTVTVRNASATSDGLQTPVTLGAMPAATVLVTNRAYVIGDSSPGSWYNAGEFGNGNLDNADVNNAFYASLGLRVPHSFSDVYNAMDTFPADGPGFVGGDGLIRYLDWQVVLQRSLRLNTNNWRRIWTAAGVRTNSGPFGLPQFGPQPDFGDSPGGNWYCQALLGAVPVGNVTFSSVVDVPVYVKTIAGASLSGMQFRVSVTPEGAAPPLLAPPQFVAADGLSAPGSVASLADEIACAWSLGALNFGSHSSNLLGYARFTAPHNVVAGDTYTVRFAFADGAPDIATAYTFETRGAQVRVGSPAPAAPIASEEWRAHYFADDDPAAADSTDADHDGSLNWQEFIAGTDPTDAASRLELRVSRQPGLTLRWPTVPGKVYDLFQSANLTDWSWRQSFTGNGGEAEFTDASGGPRFYRLRVQP